MLDAKDVESIKKMLDDFRQLNKEIEDLNTYDVKVIALDEIVINIEEEKEITKLLLANRKARLEELRKRIKDMI